MQILNLKKLKAIHNLMTILWFIFSFVREKKSGADTSVTVHVNEIQFQFLSPHFIPLFFSVDFYLNDTKCMHWSCLPLIFWLLNNEQLLLLVNAKKATIKIVIVWWLTAVKMCCYLCILKIKIEYLLNIFRTVFFFSVTAQIQSNHNDNSRSSHLILFFQTFLRWFYVSLMIL